MAYYIGPGPNKERCDKCELKKICPVPAKVEERTNHLIMKPTFVDVLLALDPGVIDDKSDPDCYNFTFTADNMRGRILSHLKVVRQTNEVNYAINKMSCIRQGKPKAKKENNNA